MNKKFERNIHSFLRKTNTSFFMMILCSFFLSSCLLTEQGKINISFIRPPTTTATLSNAAITNVAIVNDQLVITGTNLSSVTKARVKDNSAFDEEFNVESATDTKIIANGKRALSFLIGSTLDLIISNAGASASFSVMFSLTDKSVTITKLSGAGVSSGQYLKFNGTDWVGASLPNSQTYLGTWNATSHMPDITTLGSFHVGDYYIVATGGSYTDPVLTTSPTVFVPGDWVMYNGASWDRIDNSSNIVASFKTRTGSVVPQTGDYTWAMITKTGSKVQDIDDVNIGSIADGYVLKWNVGTSKWVAAADDAGVAAGSIVDSDISGSANIAQAKISGLTTALTGKEPTITAGTASQYLRGNKTLGTFLNDVLNSALTGYAIGTNTALTSSDTILQAMQKLQGQVSAVSSDYISKSNSGQTITGAFSFTSPASFLYTNTPTGATSTEVTNVAYVTSAIAANGVWAKSGSNLSYSAGNVGIGGTTATSPLTVTGASALNGNLTVTGSMINTATTNANSLTSITADFTSSNIIRSTAAAAACGTLNFTNVSNGSYTITLLNATTTCSTVQLSGSATNVKLPANYAGGASVSGIVYTAVYDGLTLWVSAVPF
jgi:hypothetical protein